jgi:lipoprotein-anchoring transpeptidase ErfK/SrfK
LEGFPELDNPLIAENKASLPDNENPASIQQVSGPNKADNMMTLGYQAPPNSGSAPADNSEPRPQPTQAFPVAREQALTMAKDGKLKEALAMLSAYFHSPELGYEQHNDLVDILDALSREVIYSKKHLAERAYKVGPTDTVASVAAEHKITPELLNAINGLGDSKALLPGSELKVVRGPIDAHVSISKQELTLFVGDLYAGRFPATFGQDPAPREGTFEVVARELDRTYYASGGNVIQGKDPMNPYGGYWVNLGDDLCIHGTPEMASSDLEQAGCISLAPLDAQHVFSILVVGSEVTVVK